MQRIKFYEELPEMEFLAGDTLDTFVIETDTEELTGADMYLILTTRQNPNEAVVRKKCTLTGENTFEVQLTSTETNGLNEGWYFLLFCLEYASGYDFKKLQGNVYVHSSVRRPQE